MQNAVVIRSLAGTILVLVLLVGLLLLAGCAVGAVEWDPLVLKAGQGDTQGVLALLNQGADANQLDGVTGITALHFAARLGHLDMTRILLERGANPNAKAIRGGWTPLHGAAYSGHEEVVRLLLQAGADPKAIDGDGRTPVMTAKESGHTAAAVLMEAASGSGGSPALPPRPASQPPPPIY